ncbi:MAG: hypothetical protein Q4C88_00890 [Akkermansia sp.]|nr:hypothetical protein [Akkermansia sp.]
MKIALASLALAALMAPATAEPQSSAPAHPVPVEATADAPPSVNGKTLKFQYGRRAAVRCRELLPSGTPTPWGGLQRPPGVFESWDGWYGLVGGAAYEYTFSARNTCTITEPGNPPTRVSATYFKTAKGEATVQVVKQAPDGGGQAEYRLTFTTPTSGVATCRIREMSRETEMVNIHFTLE